MRRHGKESRGIQCLLFYKREFGPLIDTGNTTARFS